MPIEEYASNTKAHPHSGKDRKQGFKRHAGSQNISTGVVIGATHPNGFRLF
jgi:hypothetical protein